MQDRLTSILPFSAAADRVGVQAAKRDRDGQAGTQFDLANLIRPDNGGADRTRNDPPEPDQARRGLDRADRARAVDTRRDSDLRNRDLRERDENHETARSDTGDGDENADVEKVGKNDETDHGDPVAAPGHQAGASVIDDNADGAIGDGAPTAVSSTEAQVVGGDPAGGPNGKASDAGHAIGKTDPAAGDSNPDTTAVGAVLDPDLADTPLPPEVATPQDAVATLVETAPLRGVGGPIPERLAAARAALVGIVGTSPTTAGGQPPAANDLATNGLTQQLSRGAATAGVPNATGGQNLPGGGQILPNGMTPTDGSETAAGMPKITIEREAVVARPVIASGSGVVAAQQQTSALPVFEPLALGGRAQTNAANQGSFGQGPLFVGAEPSQGAASGHGMGQGTGQGMGQGASSQNGQGGQVPGQATNQPTVAALQADSDQSAGETLGASARRNFPSALGNELSALRHPAPASLSSGGGGQGVDAAAAGQVRGAEAVMSAGGPQGVSSSEQTARADQAGQTRAGTNDPSEQISVKLRKAASNGDSVVKVQLRPHELGRVEVKLDIASDGSVRATVSAERPETLELLQRDARVLERALQDAGLKTNQDSLSFSLQGGEDGNQAANSNADAEGRGGSGKSGDPEVADDAAGDGSAGAGDETNGIAEDGALNMVA